MTIEIPIQGETIRLGQLLKLAGVADSGSEAKALLAGERVLVNGERETRRGRQLRDGDVVRVGSEGELHVRAGAPPPPPSAGSTAPSETETMAPAQTDTIAPAQTDTIAPPR